MVVIISVIVVILMNCVCRDQTDQTSPIHSHTVSKLAQYVFTAVCLLKVSGLKLCNSSKYTTCKFRQFALSRQTHSQSQLCFTMYVSVIPALII